MKYGYARVSSDGQSVDAQVRQLTKAGCKKVFRETASGAKTDRAQLRRLLGQIAPKLLAVIILHPFSVRLLLRTQDGGFLGASRTPVGQRGVGGSASMRKSRIMNQNHSTD